MHLISFLKKNITAINVPACTAISNDKPKSFVSKINVGKSKWAELEIGKNSVKPWIRPSKKLKK
tara:strand:+ start:521 stop:712 length:192 start_codon:yes stop_codon:yes gene_type:complete